MKHNPATFYSLPEAELLIWLYDWFHRVDGGGLENPKTYALVEMKGPLRFFSNCYRKYPVLKKNFKKHLPREDYSAINKTVRDYSSSATLEEWIDSGLIDMVENPAKSVAPKSG